MINVRRAAAMLLLFPVLAGCQKTSPLRSSPTAAITSLRGSVTSVMIADHPRIDAVVKVEGLMAAGSTTPIIDLKVGNIVIVENGMPVVVEGVSACRTPFSAVLVLDRSGSMSDEHNTLNQAVLGFISGVGVYDQVAIIDFSTYVTITQHFTNNQVKLTNVINSSKSEGGTALWAACGVALDVMQDATSLVQLLILMSDGFDTASEIIYGAEDGYTTTAAQASAKAQSMGIAVQCIGYSSYDYGMINLAAETGGSFYYASQASDLISIYSGLVPSAIDNTIVHYRTRDSGYKDIDVYVHYGEQNLKVSSRYKSNNPSRRPQNRHWIWNSTKNAGIFSFLPRFSYQCRFWRLHHSLRTNTKKSKLYVYILLYVL